MKKMTSIILLGLILAASLSLTGCQSETEPEAGTGDSVSGAETESGVSQTGNEMETNQPEKNVSDLKITAEGVSVEAR